ncbi:MAG: acyl-CoA thioesterase II [Gammaproteobacteria bacterium]|nr:acyl-CoA thioesterase II [Gammaproteobacteria bacterium]
MDIEELVEHLNVEQIDKLLFRGLTPDNWRKRVYGGQVLAQALNAALRTVDSDRKVHSLHAYFLRPGNPKLPIIYDVDPIRDGRSFTTRRVVAIQNGKAIFNTSISFQIAEEGLNHQIEMPDVEGPEKLTSDEEYLRRLAEEHPNLVTPGMRNAQPIEIRRLQIIDPMSPIISKPQTGFWMRSKGSLADEPIIHQTMLAYLSDYFLMGTALLPHGVTFFNSKLQGASLDHVLYFHDYFRADQWLYYHMDSPVSSGGRGLNRGTVYTQNGRLVASSIQEGLMRIHQ